MSSRYEFHEALTTLFVLVFERERNLAPHHRLHLAIAAVADAARAEHPSAAMAAEARRFPQIRNEVREARELAAVGPHLRAAAAAHGLDVSLLLNPNVRSRSVVRAKDEARSRCLAAGIAERAIGRVMGCSPSKVVAGARRHEARAAAAVGAGARKAAAS